MKFFRPPIIFLEPTAPTVTHQVRKHALTPSLIDDRLMNLLTDIDQVELVQRPSSRLVRSRIHPNPHFPYQLYYYLLLQLQKVRRMGARAREVDQVDF